VTLKPAQLRKSLEEIAALAALSQARDHPVHVVPDSDKISPSSDIAAVRAGVFTLSREFYSLTRSPRAPCALPVPFRRLLRDLGLPARSTPHPKPRRAPIRASSRWRSGRCSRPCRCSSDGGGTWVKVDTLTVATRTNQNVSTGVQSAVALEAGQTYLAVAHGMARIATDATGFADAEYIRYNKNTGPQDGSSTGLPWNNHGVRLAGVVGGTTTGNLWGTYQSDHQYVKTFVGQGTKVTGYYSRRPGVLRRQLRHPAPSIIYALVPTVAVTAATSATEGGAAGTFTLTRSGGEPVAAADRVLRPRRDGVVDVGLHGHRGDLRPGPPAVRGHVPGRGGDRRGHPADRRRRLPRTGRDGRPDGAPGRPAVRGVGDPGRGRASRWPTTT
jgi:hypothetical protein